MFLFTLQKSTRCFVFCEIYTIFVGFYKKEVIFFWQMMPLPGEIQFEFGIVLAIWAVFSINTRGWQRSKGKESKTSAVQNQLRAQQLQNLCCATEFFPF